MRYRKQRIAFSAIFAALGVLLLVLWPQSYWWLDGVSVPITTSKFVAAWSGGGRVEFQLAEYGGPAGPANPWTLARLSREEVQDYAKAMGTSPETRYFGRTKLGFLLPTWILILAAFALAATPWLPTRFSLRTLMIATTLLALLLALVVAAM